MQAMNLKLLGFLAMLGFFRGCFEENLLALLGGASAIDQRRGMPLWFWIALPLFAPVGTFLFLYVENRLQLPLLRWLVCHFAFAQQGGYAVGALGRGILAHDFISTMNGLAALGLAATIWIFVTRYPQSDWNPERRFSFR
jgi:hypothetical protein